MSFGDPPLLEHVALQVEKGERVALIGRNGEEQILRISIKNEAPRSKLQRGIAKAIEKGATAMTVAP